MGLNQDKQSGQAAPPAGLAGPQQAAHQGQEVDYQVPRSAHLNGGEEGASHCPAASTQSATPNAKPQGRISGDFWGGLAAMLVALPSAVAFGVTVYSGFGAEYGAHGAIAGILGATLLGLIAPALGGTDRLITAPCAPAAAVLAATAIGLMAEGASPETGMLSLMLVALLAGLLQMAFGAIGIGRLIKFIPYPVVCGYLSAVGLTIIGSQLPRVLGVPKSQGFWEALLHPAGWNPVSLALGVLVVLATVFSPRFIRSVPGPIVGMLSGVLGLFAFGLFNPALLDVGNNPLLVGSVGGAGMGLLDVLGGNIRSLEALRWSVLPGIVLPALTLATLLSIDTLKTCVVLDTLTGTHHRPDRELIAQGVANVGSVLCGGIPGAGQMGASMVNLSSGAQSRRSGLIEGGLALAVLLLLSQWLAWIPIAALGGILLVVGFRMIDRHSFAFFQTKATRFDFMVIVVVVVTALMVGLVAASGVGIALAIALFLREQANSTILHRKIEGGEQFSRVARHDHELSILLKNGQKTVIVELQGSLFFGTAHQLYLALEPEIGPRTYVILNMRRVQSIDLTATHVLEQIKDRLAQAGAFLIFTEIPRGLPSGLKMKRYLTDVGLVKSSSKALAFRHMDQALEWIEAQLLVEADCCRDDDAPPLELAEFEQVLGWQPGTLTQLSSIMDERLFEAGEKIFAAGDAGGKLLFIRSGSIRVEVVVKKKDVWHIGTFGRGDFIGEMGFLDSERRTADAVAVTATRCYVLKRSRFDALAQEGSQGQIRGAALFEGIATVLAMRLRFTNRELRVLRT